jgi:hypothetical protein
MDYFKEGIYFAGPSFLTLIWSALTASVLGPAQRLCSAGVSALGRSPSVMARPSRATLWDMRWIDLEEKEKEKGRERKKETRHVGSGPASAGSRRRAWSRPSRSIPSCWRLAPSWRPPGCSVSGRTEHDPPSSSAAGLAPDSQRHQKPYIRFARNSPAGLANPWDVLQNNLCSLSKHLQEGM